MPRPQASAAGDERWTMEGFQALQALDRSRRSVWFAIVGSPAVACVWAFTIDLSRQFEAGRRAPRRGAGLFEFVWFYFSLGVEELVGRTGIHVAFASLLAMAVGVGLWGSMQRRDLDRRGVTARALRHEQGTRLRWLRTGEQGAEPEAPGGHPPARLEALPALLQLWMLGRRLMPFLSLAATAYFVWLALAR